jgi:hypothetical protein
MANQLGKQYVCTTCGTVMLVTKPGTGALECCEKVMEIKGQKPKEYP